MKITSVEITAENVPADLSVSQQGVITGTPASEGSTDVPVKAVTNYGETTGRLTVVITTSTPKFGLYKADGTKLADITLSDLKKKIGDGTALSEYGLGAYFSVPYTDPFDNVEYSCQYRFGHFGQFTYSDGTVGQGLGLDCVSVLPATDDNGVQGVQFDATEPKNSDIDRKKWGNNRYKLSNLRQYMNSSGTNWYEAQHSADSAPTDPSNWNSVKGLLDCFPSDFVDSLDPVQIKVQTANADNGVVDTVNDLFFLQSVNELGYASYDTNMVGANVEGEFWGLYKELSGYSQQEASSATSRHNWLVKKNIKSGDAWSWWTRSACLGISYYVLYVHQLGYLRNDYVYGAYYGFAPACVLRAS